MYESPFITKDYGKGTGMFKKVLLATLTIAVVVFVWKSVKKLGNRVKSAE